MSLLSLLACFTSRVGPAQFAIQRAKSRAVSQKRPLMQAQHSCKRKNFTLCTIILFMVLDYYLESTIISSKAIMLSLQ